MKTLDYITGFDSSTTMLYALGQFLHGKEFRGVGVAPNVPAFVGDAINTIPEDWRTSLYGLSGWAGAMKESKLKKIKSEDIAQWVVDQYPKRKYPGVIIGSSNGAVIHLAAALGIPWFPQTYLLSVRRLLPPDEIKKDAEWGKKMVKHFLPQNPDLLAYQMHDPLQDRLMIQKMGYFRLKRTKLGKPWEDFLKKNLKPGGIIYTSECSYPWWVYSLGERHTFQIGGLGGLTSKEYLTGCAKIDRFLQNYKTNVRKWYLPIKATKALEAEWGFAPALLEDIKRFAKKHGYRVKRICFNEPEDVSPLAADFYRWWYRKLKWNTDRMLGESFALLEPLWTFKTESIPFWLAFNTRSSLKALRNYLKSSKPFREIHLMLMSNGVKDAIGLVSIKEWKAAISHAKGKHGFVGVDEEKYPADIGTFLRYHDDLRNKIGARREVPPSLTIADFEKFLKEKKRKYRVTFC
ncbi:MAG: hypothetical protein HYZ84_05230 [Candidatus Omnitrophica bacterium]|nr:hypothetical protein [Candidatus Omnitrophota bacterium]